MEIQFSEYRFLRDQLILYRQQEIIPLKHTQALLLDFFLSDHKAIHGKEAIMASVWQDKVVSEQVVFQTISQLRALFGTSAIKTYSKKGYQWQLTPELAVVDINSVKEATKNNEEASKTISVKHAFTLKYVIIAVIIVCSGVFYWLTVSSSNKLLVFHLIDSKINDKNSITDNVHASSDIEQFERVAIKASIGVMSARQSFTSPRRAWQLSAIPADEWLLWAESYQANDGVFLHYGLAKGDAYWQGYLFTDTAGQLTDQLAKRLIELEKLGIFSHKNNELDIATLESMIKTSENDPDLLLQLATYYLDIKQYDVALTYAQKLSKLSVSYQASPYRAKAQWLMAEVYNEQGKYQLASYALEKMSNTLSDKAIWPLHVEYIKAKAWLAEAQADYKSMFDILDRGIEFGLKNTDALTQFELNIQYSILAKKAGDHHKKYAYLNEAQALLLEHNLDESNFAIVYYHFAIFTQDLSKSVPYLEKILALPRTANNDWVIDHATELLIAQYIERQEFELALILLEDLKGSAKYMLSMARIYQAKQLNSKASSHFEKAFELARLNYEVHIAVDSALALYSISEQYPVTQAQYLDYLKGNTSAEWLNDKLKLIEAQKNNL
jgi:DNA-binding winged helix-turn-helix (wHTH) protein